MNSSYPFPDSLPLSDSEIALRVLLWTWAATGWFAVAYAWKRPRRWLDQPMTWLLYVAVGVVFYLLVLTPAWREKWSVHGGMIAIALAANIGGTRVLVRTGATRSGLASWLILNFAASLIAIPFLSALCTNGHNALTTFPCHHTLKGVAFAVHQYADQHESYFPPAVSGEPEVSWRVAIVPYLFQGNLAPPYGPESAWDSPANLAVARTRMAAYSCGAHPAPQDAQGRWYTAFAAVTGEGTVFPRDRQIATRDIKDGTSNTAMIVEACGRNIVWTEPRDVDVQQLPLGVNLPGNRPGDSSGIWSSYHVSSDQHVTVFTLMADGSVRPVHRDTDPHVLKSLSTIDGGEKVKDW